MERGDTFHSKSIKTHNLSKQSFNLPKEIIEEILSRLPVKSLLKFRCVSKQWRSLIGSKRFVKKHLDDSSRNSSFAYHGIIIKSIWPNRELKQCSLLSMLDDPFTDLFKSCDLLHVGCDSFLLVGCCNGIVCILIEHKRFLLWNPATRTSKILPAIDFSIHHGHITCYGFGYDELSGDYKVFGVISLFLIGHEAITKVYSLESDSWKLVKNGSVSPLSEKGKFASGSLHWSRTSSLRLGIASFNFSSEAYGVVELPKDLGGGLIESMGVLEGSLSLLYNYKRQLDIWIMKEYGVRESWVKVATIPHLVVDAYDFSALFAVGPNGEILLTLGSSFVIYYPKGNGYLHCQAENLPPFREANVYVESLVSLLPSAEQE